MSYLNDRYWITFNGEIFNFLELKKELKFFGYKFYNNTDTEVILASYDKWEKIALTSLMECGPLESGIIKKKNFVYLEIGLEKNLFIIGLKIID